LELIIIYNIMIKIYKDTIVYIVCPASTATGGPELLHQLAYHLIKRGINTFMYYYPCYTNNPIHPDYLQYAVPFTNQIIDNENNLLIFPESYKYIAVPLLYKHIRKAMWFLSIDNYYISRLKKLDLITRIKNKINSFSENEIFDITLLRKRHFKKINIQNDIIINNSEFVLTNSFRGLDYLTSVLHRDVFYLSEYINDSFFKISVDIRKKENIVVYNPKKGLKFTNYLIKRANGIQFIPIINMKRDDVIELLKRAKVYIDFGNHPGKDRLPREAAIMYCCVITGTRGSAGNYKDVPIPSSFKFNDKKENINQIINTIKHCFDNYNNIINKYEYYRNFVRNEEYEFIRSINLIFRKE